VNRDAVDLFCGCGGLSLGLAAAGFDVVAGVDAWKPAIDVYRLNNPGHKSIQFDLSDEARTASLVRSHNPFLVAGGPPCQDFSSAGDRIEGLRADLTVKFARVIAKTKPPAFLMENVPRASLSEAYKTATRIFRKAGYGITARVVDAAFCGVPQTRKRLFMIGMLGENDGFLEHDLSKKVIEGKPRTIRQHFGKSLPFEHYYRHPRTYGSRAIFSVDEPSATIRGVNRPLPSTYRKHHLDSTDPGPEVRALTHIERALIQTFPESYIWPPESQMKKAVMEQMIGNAVPVRLAATVAGALYEYAESKETPGADDPPIEEALSLGNFFAIAAE